MYKIHFDEKFKKNIKRFDVMRQKLILKKIDFLRVFRNYGGNVVWMNSLRYG